MNKVQVNNTEPFTVGGSIMIGNVKLMVVSIGDDYLEVPQSLDEVISEGLVRMAEAVEAVIAKHEGEIKGIEDNAKAEKESSLMSIASKGNCHDYDHSLRMAGITQAQGYNGLRGMSGQQCQGMENVGLSSLGYAQVFR